MSLRGLAFMLKTKKTKKKNKKKSTTMAYLLKMYCDFCGGKWTAIEWSAGIQLFGVKILNYT